MKGWHRLRNSGHAAFLGGCSTGNKQKQKIEKMYKELGKFCAINLRSISYTEDRIEDERLGYKWAFDLELLPCVKISNHRSRVSIIMRWLNWELIWFKYKWHKV